MELSHGFPPVARSDAQLLILGSLPGAMSLAQRQYYAQARNGFWFIMGSLAGALPELPYEERLERLKQKRIALWDVCAAGERKGSLDTSINLASVVTNEFAEFFTRHRRIKLIGFNGTKASDLYQRLVVPTLPEPLKAIAQFILPSTSPAHASLSIPQKTVRWREVLGHMPD